MPDNSGKGGGGDVISIGGRDRKLSTFLVLRVCVKLSGVPGDEVSVSKQDKSLLPPLRAYTSHTRPWQGNGALSLELEVPTNNTNKDVQDARKYAMAN